MDRATLAKTMLRTSRLEGHFTLRSGETSDTYFDKYLFEADPVLLRRIGELMIPLIPDDTEVLCGLELGGIPLVTVLSQITDLHAAFIRKHAKGHGTKKYAEGSDLIGRRIVLVEDVVSGGGAILDACSMLRSDAIFVETALCVIDRQTGGRDALAQAGVALRSLFTMAELEDDA